MSILYHKIPGLYKRQEEKPFKLIEGVFRQSEIEMLQNIQWRFTEKIDGMNIRIIWDGYKITFGGRTDKAQIPKDLLLFLESTFSGPVHETIFEQLFGVNEVVIFGEGCGPGIQKNGVRYGPTKIFIPFDISVNKLILAREDVEDIASKFDLSCAPILYKGNIGDAVNLVKGDLKSFYGDFTPEGIVGVPKTELCDRRGDRIIVKIKREDFV